MNGERFEKQLSSFYKKEGFEVRLTQKTNDKGIDLLLEKGGRTIAVQAKGYAEGNKVPSSAIQKASGLLVRNDIDEVRVATTSSFTTPAQEVARNRGVKLTRVSVESQRTNRQSHNPRSGSAKSHTGQKKSSTSSASPASYPNRTVEEYTCPSCGKVMKRTGWSPYYHHFNDCELPEEKPRPLSDDQWSKIQEKIAQPKSDSDDAVRSTGPRFASKADNSQNHQPDSSASNTSDDDESETEEYTCPSCGKVMKRTGWSPYYHHFKDCELPEEKPRPLSDDQWSKIQEKIAQPKSGSDDAVRNTALRFTSKSNGSQNNRLDSSAPNTGDNDESGTKEYTCPSCGEVMKRTGWSPYYHHFKDCELPEEKPGQLSDEQWRKIQERIR